jgi:ferredoxin-NADP reductase/ferredoxin/predicted pyridoxine 5'-phosphate oxidase superfamily flavin-nucleotide-binding protein
MEVTTRRRNRLAMRVAAASNGSIELTVDQAFGNCPQYIQTRLLSYVRSADAPFVSPPPEIVTALDVEARKLINDADTFFVASAATADDSDPTLGADVSHRGGRPGFVRIDKEGTLTVPDFTGNFHFNTLGNFAVYPKAGLLFVDFETGDLLQLTGEVEIIWDGPEVDAFQGAERLWKFRPVRIIRLRDAIPLRFCFGQSSPNNGLTGTWAEAERRVEEQRLGNAWRPYRVVRVKDESAVIRSFYLEPADHGATAPFMAGQHLTIRLTPDPELAPLVRTYTLSSAPGESLYRISVRRESHGAVSRFLHDKIEAGDLIEARRPNGTFTFDASEKRPAVLMGAGAGITPMISMAAHAAHESQRTHHRRSVTIIQAARESAHRAFGDEFAKLARASSGDLRVFSVLGVVGPGDVLGDDYVAEGRVTADLLQTVLPLDDYDFYLCGPAGFMQSMYDLLRELGVRDSRILAESFGPSALTRRADSSARSAAETETTPEALEAIVEFSASKFEMPWKPADGSLLELAEAHGVDVPYGCRNGVCGTCSTRVLAGEVTYRSPPSATVPAGEALVCCAVPAAPGATPVVLDL